MLGVIVICMCAYFAAHMAFYLDRVKKGRVFSEGGVLSFHVRSILVGSLVVFLLSRFTGEFLALRLTVIFFSLHAIYSLSFLEVWALVDGSYSLTILEALDAKRKDRQTITEDLVKLGSAKMTGRLEALIEAGLIMERNGCFRLTGIGRLVARPLTVILRLTNQTVAA